MPNKQKTKVINKSFQGKDLSKSNFSGTNISGFKFNDCLLVNADFSNTKTGLSLTWFFILYLIIILFSSLTSVICGYSASYPILLRKLLTEESLSSVVLLILAGCFVISAFGFVLLKYGIGSALGTLAITTAASTAIIAFLGDSSSGIITVAIFIQPFVIAIIVSGVLTGALAVTLSILFEKPLLLLPVIAISIFLQALSLKIGLLGSEHNLLSFQSIPAILFTLSLLALIIYIGKQAGKGNKKYSLIHNFAINLYSRGGTNFQGSDLSGANFRNSTLKFADFRKAKLTHVCWFNTKKLEFSRLDDTYLSNKLVQNILITKDGRNQNYDYLDLRGVNLDDACLSNASFIAADLSETTMRNANLSQAKLVKTQLYGTDLTQACLTGTFIQDWVIATDTKLDGVKCEYIYMRLPTPDDPAAWRKPDNRNEIFREGDFADFIAPIVKTLDLYRQQNIDPRRLATTFKTLDLYHYQGIDPSAAAIAVKQLSENYPEAGLEVVSLEGRGTEKIHLQAFISNEASSSQLNEEYFQRYQEISSLPHKDIQALLISIVEKDDRIRSLEQMVASAIQSQKYYVETYYNIGDTVTEKDASINIQAGGNVSGIVGGDVSGVVNLGTISGNVSNAINQLPDAQASEEPGLKELLTQLQNAIENEPELPREDKAEALEQVETLAQTGKNPQDGALKKAGKTALKILKGTTAGLSETSNLVQECTKLLPAIAALLLLL